MTTQPPSSLDSSLLARRLGELAGEERNVQVDFLLHLDEFDRRRAFLEAGFGSLWDFCLRALHLREGAAGRRIGAMRVLRRFPKLEAALRDGRLCLSTLALLGQVLTEENAEELLARAAYRTKAEVDHLVASVQPRRAPKEGIRKLPEPGGAASEVMPMPRTAAEVEPEPAKPLPISPPAVTEALPLSEASAPRARTAEVRAVSEGLWSIRATIDARCKEDLEALAMLLSHKLPGADLAAVLHEAIRCGLEKHGKRKGSVEPSRRRGARPQAGSQRAIPAQVRREVWKRDGGCCTWKGQGGERCGSRWQVEIDHVRPLSQGGTSTVSNLRCLCRAHNMLHAEEIYGREHMDRFRRGACTISGDSARAQG